MHNALGYCYLNMEKIEESVVEFKKAVELQPGYVTAWNNLGDAYEKTKSWRSVGGRGRATVHEVRPVQLVSRPCVSDKQPRIAPGGRCWP